YSNRIHNPSAICFSIPRLIVQMLTAQAVRAMVPVSGSRAFRNDQPPAHLTGERIGTGVIFIIMFLVFFPFILTVHCIFLLKVFDVFKSSGRFAGLLHASLPASYNSTSVVLQTAYPFLYFIRAHKASITEKTYLSNPPKQRKSRTAVKTDRILFALTPPCICADHCGSPHTCHLPSRWSADPDPGWTASAARTAGGAGASSFPGQSCEVVFSLHIRLGIQPPQFNDLGQHLIDGKSIKAVQPFLRRIRDGRVGMLRHHIADILKHFQREQIQIGTLHVILVNPLFQIPQVFVNIPVEPHPVNPGNGGGGLKRDLLPINRDIFLHAHNVSPPISSSSISRRLDCCTPEVSGSVTVGIYTEVYQPV